MPLPPSAAISDCTGEASQDELKLWLDRIGPDGAVILKRVKN